MKSSKSNEIKKAFVVTPIGSNGTSIRRSTDGLISAVLQPLLSKLGYEVEASHTDNDQGMISHRIIEHLLFDDLVIVNVSGLNPNVMYELGIRHATGLPTLLISNDLSTLPFDIKDLRSIEYTDDMQGTIDLASTLENILSDSEKLKDTKRNPVLSIAKDNIIESQIKEMDFTNITSQDIVQELFKSVEELKDEVSRMNKRHQASNSKNVYALRNKRISKDSISTPAFDSDHAKEIVKALVANNFPYEVKEANGQVYVISPNESAKLVDEIVPF